MVGWMHGSTTKRTSQSPQTTSKEGNLDLAIETDAAVPCLASTHLRTPLDSTGLDIFSDSPLQSDHDHDHAEAEAEAEALARSSACFTDYAFNSNLTVRDVMVHYNTVLYLLSRPPPYALRLTPYTLQDLRANLRATLPYLKAFARQVGGK